MYSRQAISQSITGRVDRGLTERNVGDAQQRTNLER